MGIVGLCRRSRSKGLTERLPVIEYDVLKALADKRPHSQTTITLRLLDHHSVIPIALAINTLKKGGYIKSFGSGDIIQYSLTEKGIRYLKNDY